MDTLTQYFDFRGDDFNLTGGDLGILAFPLPDNTATEIVVSLFKGLIAFIISSFSMTTWVVP